MKYDGSGRPPQLILWRGETATEGCVGIHAALQQKSEVKFKVVSPSERILNIIGIYQQPLSNIHFDIRRQRVESSFADRVESVSIHISAPKVSSRHEEYNKRHGHHSGGRQAQ